MHTNNVNMRTNDERALRLKAVGLIAAIEVMAHKAAIGCLKENICLLAQNEAALGVCKAIGSLREEVVGKVLYSAPYLTCEETREAGKAAIKAEIQRHKAYTAKRIMHKLYDFEVTIRGTMLGMTPVIREALMTAKNEVGYFCVCAG